MAPWRPAARDGAHCLKIDYAEEKPAAGFGSDGAETVAVKAVSKTHEDPAVGNAAAAFAAAPVIPPERLRCRRHGV